MLASRAPTIAPVISNAFTVSARIALVMLASGPKVASASLKTDALVSPERFRD